LTVLQLSDSKFSVFLANFIATRKKLNIDPVVSLWNLHEFGGVAARAANGKQRD